MHGKDSADEKVFDGEGLERVLSEKRFEHPPVRLIGMAKSSERSGQVSFAQSGCHSWVDIPVDMIEKAEHIGHQPCKDHSHPLFSLRLKEQPEPKAQVLLRLLAERPPQWLSTGAPPQSPRPLAANGGGISGLSGQTQMLARQCDSFCSGSTLICVCQSYIPWLGVVTSIFPCGTCINDPISTGSVFTAFA